MAACRAIPRLRRVFQCVFGFMRHAGGSHEGEESAG